MLEIIILNILGNQIINLIIIYIFLSLFIIYFINWQVVHLLKNYKINNLSTSLTPEKLNKELEPFGFSYLLKSDIFISNMYSWQRECGYTKSYDQISPLLCMIIDCEPIHFEYDNRRWLIEFWKGQYGMTTGGEIGFYVSDNLEKKSIYYSVDDDELIYMSFKLIKKNKLLLARKNLHWWLTGFKLGEFSKPSDLVMDIEITLKNKEMCDAFVVGLKNTGYKDNEIVVKENTVCLTFNKPYTKQPFTKKRLLTFFVQNYNKNNCKFYNKITKNYTNSLDKINYIRSRFPIMYEISISFKKLGHANKKYISIHSYK